MAVGCSHGIYADPLAIKGLKSGALKMLELNLYTSTGMRLVRYYSK